ncbi:LOW QUALITY PROTEIN: double-strand-break repair protein rad21-like protein 1 [Sceloporus undulatus]|uniref:LOW QUALITY PROTEIN: double-strand-break repair protein rad21-like protein 1 n=1 Tax=Sceloporus undulatus TaxID=8520 RepID=UPI001C4AC2A5|nr:LOW QUALITY PROTEIN: double-strand-break repair protein rad21-like protein 1 [Sceloporus undulatus]
MFYMQLLMNKRGPLAKIWLAAHWDKKVTKAHIFECNLETTIEKILSPKCAIALRTSGHLLLGVVRIYHRKTKYLLADCNEALLKMQTAFRPGLVDLPRENCEANYDAITLPEEFHDFDTQLPEVNAIDVAQHFTLNQSKAEDITLMEEDFRLPHGDSFGEEIEIPRSGSFFNDSLLPSSIGVLADHSSLSITENKIALSEDAYVLKHDGFGDEGTAEDMIDSVLGDEHNSLLELFGIQDELIQTPPADNIVDHPTSKEEAKSHQLNETRLLSNKEEGFVLEPIDNSALIRKQRGKKKRKLLVDAVKEISKSTMENQLMYYKDTITTLDIAPPTKKLMILQEMGGVDKLLDRPGQLLINEDLQMVNILIVNTEPIAEDSSNSQDIVHPKGLTILQNDRDERNNNDIKFETTEAVEIVSGLSDGFCADSSVKRESETEQAAVESEFQGSNIESEEKRRHKRTLLLLNTFRHINQTGAKSFSLLDLCKNQNNKEVAITFCSLLVLKKQRAVDVAQAAPYADIIVTKGPKFHIL